MSALPVHVTVTVQNLKFSTMTAADGSVQVYATVARAPLQSK